nr:hypothetical protein [Sphingobium sp. TCM1]
MGEKGEARSDAVGFMTGASVDPAPAISAGAEASRWPYPEQFQEARSALPCLDPDRLILKFSQIILSLKAPDRAVVDLEERSSIIQPQNAAQPQRNLAVAHHPPFAGWLKTKAGGRRPICASAKREGIIAPGCHAEDEHCNIVRYMFQSSAEENAHDPGLCRHL